MKAAILVFALVLATAVDCANHNRRHKNNKNEDHPSDGEGGDDVTEWPTPNSISDFQVPAIFTGGSGDGGSNDGEDLSSGRHHSKSTSKGRSH